MNLGRWRDLVSAKVGLIREVVPLARGLGEPVPPYLCRATLSHFDFRTVDPGHRGAGGKGLTEAEAIASAIGEAVERYCAHQWDPARTWIAPLDAVEHPAIAPAELVLYGGEQARDATQGVTWIDGIELPGASPVALPASFVFLVNPPRPEDVFAPSTSNGLAAGPTLAAAVLGGLCELMERDAMLITWMNRLPARELDLEGSGSVVAGIVRHYRRRGVDVRAFLLPSDLPAAVVMAVSFEPDASGPAQVVGMGCHPSPAVAVTKAIFELCQMRPGESWRFNDEPPRGRLSTYADVRTLEDHSAFASVLDNRHEFEFLWAEGGHARVSELPDPSTGDPQRDLDHCVDGLVALGCRVAYVDLTLPDVASFDLRVVRTVATGLQPLHFGHGAERLGGRRLFEVPHRLGLRDRPTTPAELNPCPHPLA